MVTLVKLMFSLCLTFGISTVALAESELNEKRGELLYTTHCDACHTSTMHWREKKLAKDWQSLKAQVARWQVMANASWSVNDIKDVTYYLNNRFYHYQNTEPKTMTKINN